MKRGISMKLYTKTICPKCLWVKSELQRAGLEAEIVNIDHDEQAKQTIIDAGFLSVPVLEMNETFIGDVQEIVSQIELITL
jgi:glutaredoxin-like protein NrdH